jgi:hypothetical protein
MAGTLKECLEGWQRGEEGLQLCPVSDGPGLDWLLREYSLESEEGPSVLAISLREVKGTNKEDSLRHSLDTAYSDWRSQLDELTQQEGRLSTVYMMYQRYYIARAVGQHLGVDLNRQQRAHQISVNSHQFSASFKEVVEWSGLNWGTLRNHKKVIHGLWEAARMSPRPSAIVSALARPVRELREELEHGQKAKSFTHGDLRNHLATLHVTS